MKKVGAFTLTADGSIKGPAAYMNSAQFVRKLAAIEAGTDMLSTCRFASPDPLTAILVSIQTDYAGWKGTQQLLNR